MNTLKAEKRTMDVKAKKLRREGYVVGNVFGREIKGSIPVKMGKKEVEKLLKTDGKGSQIMLDVDGTQYDVLIKDVLFNPTAGRIDEIDFQALVQGEKVHSVAEVILVNHDKLAAGVAQELLKEVSYKALPSALVDSVKVDLSTLKIGDTVKVKDLDIAKDKDIVLMTDPDTPVVTVTAVHNVVPETEAEEAAEDDKAAK